MELVVELQSTEVVSWDLALPRSRQGATHVFPLSPWSSLIGNLFRDRAYNYVRVTKVEIDMVPWLGLSGEGDSNELMCWIDPPRRIKDFLNFDKETGRRLWMRAEWKSNLPLPMKGTQLVWTSADPRWMANSAITPLLANFENSFCDIGYCSNNPQDIRIIPLILGTIVVKVTSQFAVRKMPRMNEAESDQLVPTIPRYIPNLLNILYQEKEVMGTESFMDCLLVPELEGCSRNPPIAIPFESRLIMGDTLDDDVQEAVTQVVQINRDPCLQMVELDQAFVICSVPYTEHHVTPVLSPEVNGNLVWVSSYSATDNMHIDRIETRQFVDLRQRDEGGISDIRRYSYHHYIDRTIWRLDLRTGTRTLMLEDDVDDLHGYTVVDWSLHQDQILIVQMTLRNKCPPWPTDLRSDIIDGTYHGKIIRLPDLRIRGELFRTPPDVLPPGEAL